MSKKDKENTTSTPAEYKCSICGKMHKRFTEPGTSGMVCPLMNNKIEKYRRLKKKNFLCANIFLECLKKEVNFFDLFYEIGYLTEMFMERGAYGDLTITNAEMAIDYFAMELNCNPKKFIGNSEDTLTELLGLLSKGSFSEPFVDKEVVGLYYDLDVTESEYSFIPGTPMGDNVRLFATKEKGYQGNAIYRLYLESPFLLVQGQDQRSHRLGWLQLGLFGDILLAEEYDGELAKMIEHEINLYWKELSEEVSADDVRFEIWINKLKQQTIENRLYWVMHDNHYTTKYDDNTFELYTNQKSAVVEIVDTIERKMYHLLFIRFGKGMAIKFVLSKEAEKTTALLSLESAIKDSIICMQQVMQQPVLQEKRITFADVLVVSSSMHCKTLHHAIVPYHGILNILTKDNTEEEYHIYVGYCKECRTYIVFSSDYYEMLKRGEPLCVVYAYDKDATGRNHSEFIYKSQSVLAKKGYNVQANANLSEAERQRILKECIDAELVQTHDLLDFLNWLVKTREPLPKYKNAIAKWKKDIVFVTEYKKEERDPVFVRSITIK